VPKAQLLDGCFPFFMDAATAKRITNGEENIADIYQGRDSNRLMRKVIINMFSLVVHFVAIVFYIFRSFL